MSLFTIQEIANPNNTIEIFAMNIDDKNNILIRENNIVSVLKLDDFKEMIFGADKDSFNQAKDSTHIIA